MLGIGPSVLVVPAVQQAPGSRNHHHAAADLHDRQGNSEESQYVGPDENGAHQQHKSIQRNLAGEHGAHGARETRGQRKEDGNVAERVHNRKQCADDQQHVAHELGQTGLHGD
jgi:hypothetical protein